MKRASSASKPPGGDSRPRLPALDDFLAQDDFTGACTLLEFQLRAGAGEGASSSAGSSAAAPQLLWLAWAAFHKGDYRRALEHYRALLEDVKPSELEGLPGASPPAALHALRACCLFYLGDVAGAEAAANAAPDGPLRNRVLFHAHAKLGNEAAMMACHAKLGVGRKEDQLCLAATHFARGHVQEALDAYKRVLAEHPEDVAIHVYIALCCFKLDYYDLSLDSLAVYLQAHPASPFAVNLKACIQYKLVNGKQAAGELRALTEQGYAVEGDDTLRHNLVVFRGGEGALGVLPGLMAALPEARLNLAMHHLKCGQLADAAALLEDVVPSSVPEYQLKASLAALWGQAQLLGRAGAAGGGAALKGVTAHEALKQARALFHAVGSSPVECDTIPGRQCMALSYFLMRKFDDANVYLQSIKQYLADSDEFNWNHGVSLAAMGKYAEAEEALLRVRSPALTSDATFVSWLARCHVMCRRSRAAWELYLRAADSGGGPAALALLRLLAGDCFATGQFFVAALAYDSLERHGGGGDGLEEAWAGKLAACAGVLQAVAAGAEARECLREVHAMLTASAAAAPVGSTMHAQGEALARAIAKWAASQK